MGNRLFITGAASGIGRLAALRYAAAGNQVFAVDVNESGLEQLRLVSDLIITNKIDIINYQSVSDYINVIEEDYGPIDMVINCAAIMPLGLLSEQAVEIMHKMMDINVKGTINVNKAVLPWFLERGRGTIVNFASIAGWVPCMYFGAYDASKAAVVSFSEVLYHETRSKGISVCCVCPPPVKTPMLLEANIQPKILDEMEVVTPDEVLDAVSRSLKKGELFCFPGKLTRLSVLVRRLFPAIPWNASHKAEGF